ncbi:uncharacterized protein LOC113436989 [Pseudonaja textilis]|uniref:uncharacterized protein LOC113436989 n=1 Tax=Pseudonaja textilis TaxID=8673 RepID=UPI000EA970A6|nr:uncharacterized protein LOC113436989 [Pseudonaja textilis]
MAFSCCFTCCPLIAEPSGEREHLNPQHSRNRERIKNVNFTKGTPLTMKRVNVPEFDALFNSIAETFNKQQDHCLSLREAIQTLRNSYDCSPVSSLSVCMEKILQEHSAYNVQVCIEGYRFWLDVGVEEVPQKLKQTQQQVRKLNFATKGIVSTTIEEMIYSVHQCQDSLMEKVKDSSPEYLDWVRLESNLKENIEKINQAQKCSEEYREAANDVLLNMAKSANLTL